MMIMMGNIMVKEHTILKMEVSMSGNGRMINTTVKVHGLEKGNGKDKNMQGNIRMGKNGTGNSMTKTETLQENM